jgi:sarcosine oxidase subunit beta
MGDPDERPGFDITVRWDFLPKVIDVAMRRLPAIADAAVSHAWAGLYEMTPDHNPIIGQSTDVDGFFTIAGFSGHGFQHAPAAGRVLADLIAGQDPHFDVKPFALDRFAQRVTRGEGNVV